MITVRARAMPSYLGMQDIKSAKCENVLPWLVERASNGRARCQGDSKVAYMTRRCDLSGFRHIVHLGDVGR